MKTIARLTVLSLLVALPVTAAIERHAKTELDPLQKTHAALYSGRTVQPYSAVSSAVTVPDAWSALAGALGPQGELYVDAGTGAPALVKGAPVPLVPGKGNDLTLAGVGQALGVPATEVDEALVYAAAQRFVDAHLDVIGVPGGELKSRGTHRVSDDLFVVTWEHAPHGIVVAGSRLTLVVGHGNLIMWGADNLFPMRDGDSTLAALDATAARSAMERYMGWQPQRDKLLAGPELVYLAERHGVSKFDASAEGKRHRLVWEMMAQREGVVGTWMTQVDAVTGEILQYGDVNQYGWIRGGIYPNTWTDPEENRPMPLVDIGGGQFSSVNGIYTEGGTPLTAPLIGARVSISDRCGTPGAPSVTADGSGVVDFGEGPPNPDGDADCTTNGVGENGGLHNTHAARSAYYSISRFKEKAKSWLPGNSWVDGSHQVRVNINSVCNAYWSPPGGFNGFFQEGFYQTLHCFNTGEVNGIFLHEVGHGLDQNDAQGSADGGTGESYADVVSMFGTHNSCNGPEFWDMLCNGYGFPCTTCTGIRDSDYAKHTDGGGSPQAVPFTPANFVASCPNSAFTIGVCGRSGHCESHVSSGAIWDLVTRKMGPVMGEDLAWFLAERDWMLGMQIATNHFNCNSSTFASDGCAATSWFNAMLAADDDDGNLANGTPNAAFIFEAFNDHAIACGSAGDAANQNSGSCTALPTPTLTATVPGSDDQIDLSWTASAGAAGYAVLKSQNACGSDYQQVAVIAAGTTVFSDLDVIPSQQYSYRVVALEDAGNAADNICTSDLSNCASEEIGSPIIFSDGFESGDVLAWSTSVE
ncbi:MAG: hypothetical protein AAF481_13445 [Acidobacteriota bacterium]